MCLRESGCAVRIEDPERRGKELWLISTRPGRAAGGFNTRTTVVSV
jgi:hypothetical protein